MKWALAWAAVSAALAAVVLLLLSSCFEVEVEASAQIAQADGSDGGIAIADYPHLVDDTFVRRLGECCGVAPANWKQEECTSLVDGQGGFQARLGTIGGSIASGKVVLDQTKAAACIATAAAIDCTEFTASDSRQWWKDCLGAIVGTVAEGDACGASVDCVDGWCSGGACFPFVTSGGCTMSEACSRWAFGSYCLAGVCTDAAGTGAPCHNDGFNVNGSCVTTFCGGGVGCVDSISIVSPGLCAFCTQ